MSLTSGLGISRTDNSESTMAPQDMLTVKPVDSRHGDDSDMHRRTLTQAQFDSYTSTSEYATVKPIDSALRLSPKQENADPFDSYLNDMSNFGGPLSGNDIHQEHTMEPFGSTSSLFPDVTSPAGDVPRKASPRGSLSGWSQASTPSLSITPVEQHADSGYAASDLDAECSPHTKNIPRNAEQWQPGSSVPCDFEAMEREFKEIAARQNTQPLNSELMRRTSSFGFADQQLAFASEQYTQSEAPASLMQSMNDMGLSNDSRGHSVSASISGGSIAARRQRSRPQPLSGTSARSASFCGPLPTLPGAGVSQTAPTLRRIKSSNVMNGGIANGRIQKNIGNAQRSPLNLTFAESMMGGPKLTRRTSSGIGSSLAPPTPLSPTEHSHRLGLQRQASQMFGARQMSRQPSINELQEESHRQMMVGANTFASPPATPGYAPQFSRNRMVGGIMNDTTPPQSAPASQQCFPASVYSTPMTASFSQGPLMSPQSASFAPVMQNMHQVVMPGQALHHPQYLEMLAQQEQQQRMANMSQLMSSSQAMQMNMGIPYGVAPQAVYATNNMYSAYPMMAQHSHPMHHSASKSGSESEFFVHEYSPPANKRLASPRKGGQEVGPKSYTFTNQGPEHFEKTKKDLSTSPDSSSGLSA